MITQVQEKGMLDRLMDNVREVYHQEAKKIVETHKREIEKELDNFMDEIVTRAGLRIQDRISITDLGREIKITIEKK